MCTFISYPNSLTNTLSIHVCRSRPMILGLFGTNIFSLKPKLQLSVAQPSEGRGEPANLKEVKIFFWKVPEDRLIKV